MRTLLAAVGLTLILAAPAHAAVTIKDPEGSKVGPHPAVKAIVDGAAKPDVTFTIGGIDTPADVEFKNGEWLATATLDLSTLDEQQYALTATSGADSDTKQLTLDKHATVGLPERFYTNDPSIAITSDADSTLQCRAGGDAFAPCTSPWKPAVGQDGTYDYDVTATDDVGNTATQRSSFVVDRTAPAITLTDGRIAITDANLDRTECTFDDAVTPSCPAAIPNDTRTYAIRAWDKAGNETTLSSAVPTVSAPDVRGAEGGILGGSAERVVAKVSLSATRTRRWTRLRTLRLTHVPAGIAVTAACHGGGCPKRAVELTAHGGTVSLKGLTGRRLKPGAVITIALRRDGKLLQTLHVTIRRTAAPRVR